MIKKIIFDVDGTLLNTEKDCFDTYNEYFKSRGITNYVDYTMKIYEIIDKYEEVSNTYEKNDLCDFINSYLDIDFTRDDFDKIFKMYQEHATILDEKIKDTLDNLSKKYELVTLSKWYVEDQEKRLEKAGLLKYFKKVYGIENAGLKPDKESFITAGGDYKLEECLMVGDSMRSDIGGARQLGMEAVLIDPKGKNKYKNKIKSVIELEEFIDRRNL
jgi:HAD superfamily hydrolase (TIGR01549 family)